MATHLGMWFAVGYPILVDWPASRRGPLQGVGAGTPPVAGTTPRVERAGSRLAVTVPSILDNEVVAIDVRGSR